MIKKRKSRRSNNEGSIYPLKNGKIGGYVNLGIDENGKRIRKFFTAENETEAEQKIANLTGKLSSLKIESFKNSCIDLMKEWLLVFRINEVTSRVFENDMRNFNIHIKPYLQNLNTADVDTVIIKKLLNKVYAKNKSLDVQKKIRTLLKQFFDYAVEEKLTQYNPVLSVKKIKKEKRDYTIEDIEKRNKAIKPEDREKFLEILKQNNFLLSLCCVGYYTGLRIGEILALKWQDFDFENNSMNVDKGVTYEVKFDENGKVISKKNIVSSPKTDASVAILPIPEILKSVLLNWFALQKEKSKKLDIDLTNDNCYIFCKDDGTIRSYYGTRSMYKNYLEKHNLTASEFHFHALRHTFGTILKDSEENLLNIQMLLRHKSAKTTERYLSMNTKKVLALKTKLDSVFSKKE